ncbi:hypothetical protein T4E_1684 [Trichinella pseudospiralis]|uniref:Uncharacterized protein n=1 Tax=Trichinella pseudospiralis TaxID=6337 RepID=A0A0V0Y5E3_TRIPS|nr:hypothetical protein T4E_5244 [Trichinella pseudospiralis]KRX95445.1 hypothetical protein T4E_1684 [Trichinella pseudospiralis]
MLIWETVVKVESSILPVAAELSDIAPTPPPPPSLWFSMAMHCNLIFFLYSCCFDGSCHTLC